MICINSLYSWGSWSRTVPCTHCLLSAFPVSLVFGRYILYSYDLQWSAVSWCLGKLPYLIGGVNLLCCTEGENMRFVEPHILSFCNIDSKWENVRFVEPHILSPCCRLTLSNKMWGSTSYAFPLPVVDWHGVKYCKARRAAHALCLHEASFTVLGSCRQVMFLTVVHLLLSYVRLDEPHCLIYSPSMHYSVIYTLCLREARRAAHSVHIHINKPSPRTICLYVWFSYVIVILVV